MQTDLSRLCSKLGIRASVKFGAPENPEFKQSTGYTVTLTYQRRWLTVPFYMGLALTSEPTAADVLSCLCSDARSIEYSSFEEWARDMGYDEDPRRAERIYRACEKLAPKLRRFLGDSYEQVCRAEH